MKNVIFVFLVLFSCLSLSGQTELYDYEAFEFESYNPKWMSMVVDSSVIGDSLYINQGTSFADTSIYNGWSNFSFIGADYGNHFVADDDKIYFFKPYKYISDRGGYLECLDKETGELDWKTVWHFGNITYKEEPVYLYINYKGNLEVIGLRAGKEGLYVNNNKNNTLVVREYDKNTGNLLNYSYGNPNGGGVKKMNLPWIGLRGRKFLLYPYGNDLYRYFEIIPGKKFYKSYVLDKDGKVVSVDSVRVIPKNPDKAFCYFDNSFLRMGKERYVEFLFNRACSDDRDSLDISVDIINKDFEIEKTRYMSEVLDSADDYRLHWSNEDYFILKKIIEDTLENGDFAFRNEFILFDKELNKLETIKLQDDNGWPLELSRRIKAIKLKGDDGMLVVGTGHNFVSDGYNTLNFYKSSGKGVLDTVRIIKVKDEKHRIAVDQIYQLDDGDIMLECRDINEKFIFGYYIMAGHWLIRFAAEDLGITGTEDYFAGKSDKLEIFPNPAKDNIKISFDDNVQGILNIYDILGQKVLNENISGNQKQIDVSSLTTGIYSIIFNPKNNEKMLRGNFVKK